MSLSKITGISGKFAHKENKILARRCRVYIAEGSFINSDIPSTIAVLKAHYEGATAKFLPLGDMDNSGSNITSEATTYETDFSTLQLHVKITATLIGVTVTKDMLDFISGLGTSEYSFLFVPVGVDNVFFALSGMTVSTNINLGIVENEPSKITFTATKTANAINEVVLYRELTT